MGRLSFYQPTGSNAMRDRLRFYRFQFWEINSWRRVYFMGDGCYNNSKFSVSLKSGWEPTL